MLSNREKVNALLTGNLTQCKEEEEVVAAMANPLGLSLIRLFLLILLKECPVLRILMLH